MIDGSCRGRQKVRATQVAGMLEAWWWWWRTGGSAIDEYGDTVNEEEGRCQSRHYRTIMVEACARFAKPENVLGTKACTGVAIT